MPPSRNLRRTRGDGSIRQRGKTWYFAIDLGRDPMTGKRQRITRTGFATKPEAARAMREELALGDRGERVDRTTVSVSEYLQDWLDNKQASQVKASTISGYRRLVDTYIDPRIGGARLQKLTPTMIEKMYRDLLTDGRQDGEGGLGARTVRSVHVVLRQALASAVRKGILVGNPAERVDPPREPRHRSGQAWSSEDVRKFLEATVDSPFRMLYLLALATGARRGELLGIRWQDVDFDRGVIHIRETVLEIAGRRAIDSPKSHQSREVSIDPRTAEALREYRRERLEGYFAVGVIPERIFCHVDGRPVSPSHVSKTFRREMLAAGVKQVRLHDLRHTSATMGMRAGVPLKAISERLGHADIGVTADTYSHVDFDLQAAAASMIGDMVHGTSAG